MPNPKSPYKRVRRGFSQAALKRVCELHETEFAEAYDLDTYVIQQRQTDNFYLFKDNGADILAVAHLDTVMAHNRRTANFVSTAAGPVVYSGALDDRLGAYTILELLPKLGIKYDIVLTVGEESGRSTGQFFTPPEGKEYNWMIEFDRGGSDVVMYQYDDFDLRALVRKSGATPAEGIFSDISYMEHLEIKGLNWGVGYRDYHGPRSHAYLEDYWAMIGHYLKFHEANAETYLPHEKTVDRWWGQGSSDSYWDSNERTRYKSVYGNGQWWDSNDVVEETSDSSVKWWDDDDHWTEEQWDAYLDGGIDAVRALGRPDGLDDDENDDVDVLFIADDDDLVSDDFADVNRSLTSSSTD